MRINNNAITSAYIQQCNPVKQNESDCLDTGRNPAKNSDSASLSNFWEHFFMVPNEREMLFYIHNLQDITSRFEINLFIL